MRLGKSALILIAIFSWLCFCSHAHAEGQERRFVSPALNGTTETFLPAAAAAAAQQITVLIYNTGTGTVTVKSNGGLVNGTTSKDIGTGGSGLFASDGTNWWSLPAAGGSGAPATARYWVGASDPDLSAEHNLGALGTGAVINTAGTPSIYAGTACANSFPRSLNASIAATCNQVDLTADVTGLLTDEVLIGTTLVPAAFVIPVCNATEKLQYSTGAGFSCVADLLSINTVEVSIDLGSTGGLVFSTTVTGLAWVEAGSEIVCAPFATTADGLTVETVAASGVQAVVANRVVATGFDLYVYSPHGATGIYRFHCTGA